MCVFAKEHDMLCPAKLTNFYVVRKNNNDNNNNNKTHVNTGFKRFIDDHFCRIWSVRYSSYVCFYIL